ncbi:MULTISPECIES: hypothetical protein [unclassified Streptomyces]|uniref:hypothetical protein n=1 Tax=unclassified Streptomyces TaxID=2593676 RepID=UPI00332377E7
MTFDLAIEAVTQNVPANWKVEEFRRHATLVDEVNAGSNMPLLSLASTGVVSPRGEEGGMGKQIPSESTIERYWIARPGDLVVNPMWLIGGGIGVSQITGAVSPDYRVYRLGPELFPPFIHHLLRSQSYRDQYRLYARAETTFDRRVSKQDFHPMPLLIPPLEEQRRIAQLLNIETARIDKLTQATGKSIALLRERVTGIIDTELSLTTQKIIPLKYLASLVDTEHKTAPHVPGGGYWIAGTSSVRGGHLVHDALYETDSESYREWTRRRRPTPGDILLSREAPVGEVAVYRPDDPRIAIGQRMVLVSPQHADVRSEYLMWSLLSSDVRRFFDLTTQGSLHPHLNMRDIGSIPIRWCNLDRQDVTLRTISRAIERTRTLIAARTAMQNLLAERRQALITVAVTGQLDVP